MYQLIDIRWRYDEKTSKYTNVMDLREENSEETQKIELKDYNFNFALSEDKTCIGYYDKDKFHSCPLKSKLDSPTRTQCYHCERLQGFKSAFLFGGEANENMSEYLSKKHLVYLAFFQPNIIKVGTASDIRKYVRPIEQDALIYAYIASNDGFNIQKLEHRISKEFNIVETVKSSHKLKFIREKINSKKASKEIEDTFNNIKSTLQESEYKTWLEKEINVIDLSGLPSVFYPDNEIFPLKTELNLFGLFKGLRGNFLIVENAGNYFIFDKRYLIGRTIVSYLDDWRYNLDMTQMSLF